jgi:hypothetical protein
MARPSGGITWGYPLYPTFRHRNYEDVNGGLNFEQLWEVERMERMILPEFITQCIAGNKIVRA